MFGHQIAGKNHKKLENGANTPSDNVATLKYLERITTNQSYIPL
jgi:hypothetical protein